MSTHDQRMMQDAASLIEHTLHAIGSHTPIQLIDHNTAILVGTFADHLTIRHQGQFWNVVEHTPYIECMHSYTNMVECARDIALCDEHAIVFDHTEERIDTAIKESLIN